MKVKRYYDICCEECGKQLSWDFGVKLSNYRMQAISKARDKGFRTVNGKFVCPICAKEKDKLFCKENKDGKARTSR